MVVKSAWNYAVRKKEAHEDIVEHEVTGSDPANQCPGSEFLCPSRNTGQGVWLCGELKRIIRESVGKPRTAHIWRLSGRKTPQSHNYCPKLDDLHLAKGKRSETAVDAWNYDDVQISMMSWV